MSDSNFCSRIVRVGQVLTAAARQFLESRQQELTPAWVERHRPLLESPANLPVFSRHLRERTAELLAQRGFDSVRYWRMIDAISFWQDAHPGVWKYATEEGRRTYLNWALLFARAA